MEQTKSNDEVAAVFQGIAELLEAQGENPFKIRAYRNAVRTLGELTEPVSDIDAQGELRKVPGFGDAIVGKTKEILATGTCELYERLKAEAAVADDEEPVDAESQSPPAGEDEDEDVPSPW